MNSKVVLVSALGISLLAACDDIAYTPAKTDAGTTTPVGPTDGSTAQCSTDPVVPCGADYAMGDPGADIAGAGLVHSWAKLDSSKQATEFSFSIPLGIVNKLSAATVDVGYWIKVPDAIASRTVLQAFLLFYSAHGHVPVGVYDTKHFDFHFWLVPEDTAKGIDCNDRTPPPAEMVPDSWLVAPPPDNCLAQHGMPAINTQAPEYNGARFVTGLEITFYKATLVSWEPKLTFDTMQQRTPTVSYTFPLMKGDPNKTMPNKLYPGTMKGTYDAKNDAYIFTVGDFATWTH